MDNNYSLNFLRIKKETKIIRIINLLEKDFDSFLIRMTKEYMKEEKIRTRIVTSP